MLEILSVSLEVSVAREGSEEEDYSRLLSCGYEHWNVLSLS